VIEGEIPMLKEIPMLEEKGKNGVVYMNRVTRDM
jgi:hypothetical protein